MNILLIGCFWLVVVAGLLDYAFCVLLPKIRQDEREPQIIAHIQPKPVSLLEWQSRCYIDGEPNLDPERTARVDVW